MPVNTSELKRNKQYTFINQKWKSKIVGKVGMSSNVINSHMGPYVTGKDHNGCKVRISYKSLECTDLGWELKS